MSRQQRSKAFMLFGVPVFGTILPYIGPRYIPLNRDGSFAYGEGELIEEARGFYYVEPLVIEWLGGGWPLTRSLVRRVDTDEIVEPNWDTAGS